MADGGSTAQKPIGLNSQSGFLAVQGLIAAAIVGIMLTVLLNVVANLSDFTGNVSAREELDMVMQRVRNALLTEDTCANAFNPISGSPITFDGSDRDLDVVGVRNAANDEVLPLIQRNRPAQIPGETEDYDGKIRIEDITLKEVAPGSGRSVERLNIPNAATGEPFTNFRTYIAKLVVNSSFNGRPQAERSVALKIYTNPADEIRRCFSLALDTESCSAFLGTVDAEGRCQLPECSANTIATWVAQGRGRDCWRQGNCVPRSPAYFLVFRGGEGSTPSTPMCICLEDCS